MAKEKQKITPGILSVRASDATDAELCELISHITNESYTSSFGTPVSAPIAPGMNHNAERITEICKEASKRLRAYSEGCEKAIEQLDASIKRLEHIS